MAGSIAQALAAELADGPPPPKLRKLSRVRDRKPDSESSNERFVEHLERFAIESANEMSQHRFRKADQLVTVNTALVFQSFFDANRYLRRKPVANRIDGSTNDGGEFGVDRNLSTHDNEHSRFLRVSRGRPTDAVEIASPQSST